MALLGRKRFEELLSGLLEKPAGKPTLVREEYPRPEYEVGEVREDFEGVA